MNLRTERAVASQQNELKDRRVPHLVVHLELKPLFEHRLQHQEHRRRRTLGTRCRIAGRLCRNVESIGVEPLGSAGHLEVRQRLRRAIRRANQHPERDVIRDEPAAGLKEDAERPALLVLLDGGRFKRRALCVRGSGQHRKADGDKKERSHIGDYSRELIGFTPVFGHRRGQFGH